MEEEITVVKLVTSYIKYREGIKPVLDEEDPANDSQVIAQLTEEEKKHREDARAAKAEEEKKAAEEAAKTEAEKVAAMEPLAKI